MYCITHKSLMCVVCTALESQANPSERGWRRKWQSLPSERQGFCVMCGIPGPTPPAFVGSCSLRFGSFPAPLNDVHSPADLHGPWAAQSLPRSPLSVGPRECWCCTRAEEQQAGTLSSQQSDLTWGTVSPQVLNSFFEWGGKEITGVWLFIYFF